MNIKVLGRARIESFRPNGPFWWISITDPGKTFVETPDHFDGQMIARCNLTFWDSETINDVPGGFWSLTNNPPTLPLPETEMFQTEQAKRILDFLKNHIEQGEKFDLLVNCEGGFSRSPAVACALAHCLGMTEIETLIWVQTCPNTRVYQTILTESQKSPFPRGGPIGE